MRSSNDDNRSAAQIQDDLKRTRSELDQTLSAIERRLAPGQLMEDGLHYLRNNGATQYVANLGDAAQRDPIPLALVGVGLAWLMLSARGGQGSGSYAGDGGGRSAVGAMASSAADGVASGYDSAVGSAKGAIASVRDAATSLRDKVSQTTEALSDTVQTARGQARQVGDTARQAADRVRSGYDYLVSEQPLALGAIGLALGVALAAAAPRTRTEDELLGNASDRAKDEVAAAGREQAAKLKGAAVAAEDAVRDSMDTQPPDLQDEPAAVLKLPAPSEQA